MKYWIFKCNTDSYDLNARLADPHPKISWKVTRYRNEITAGDIAFIWETGSRRAFRAIIRLDTDPHETEEIESEQIYNRTRDNKIISRVTAKIIERDMNIPSAILRTTPGLENLSLFNGYQQGTNFRMTFNEAGIINKIYADLSKGKR